MVFQTAVVNFYQNIRSAGVELLAKLITFIETGVKWWCEDRVKSTRQCDLGSLKQCVELTRTFADGEIVVFDSVEYLEDLLHLLANITKGLWECSHLSLPKEMYCVFQTFTSHFNDCEQIFDTFFIMHDRWNNITHKIYQNVHSCIDGSKALVSACTDNIFFKMCGKQAFFIGMLDSMKSKFQLLAKR